MNKVMLIGRLTAKPELRYTSANKANTKFGLAVNRNFTNSQGQRDADFINCVCFNKQAENVCNYLDKGSLVSIEGRIQTGSYEGQDGIKKYTFDVMVDNVQFLETKKTSSNAQKNDDQVSEQATVQPDPYTQFGEQVSIDDDFLD